MALIEEHCLACREAAEADRGRGVGEGVGWLGNGGEAGPR